LAWWVKRDDPGVSLRMRVAAYAPRDRQHARRVWLRTRYHIYRRRAIAAPSDAFFPTTQRACAVSAFGGVICPRWADSTGDRASRGRAVATVRFNLCCVDTAFLFATCWRCRRTGLASRHALRFVVPGVAAGASTAGAAARRYRRGGCARTGGAVLGDIPADTAFRGAAARRRQAATAFARTFACRRRCATGDGACVAGSRALSFVQA